MVYWEACGRIAGDQLFSEQINFLTFINEDIGLKTMEKNCLQF